MAGLVRALRQHARLCVLGIATCGSSLPHPIEIAPAHILLFDLAAVTADQLRRVVHSDEAITLIGIDTMRSRAITFTGSTSPLHTVDDLINLLDLVAEPVAGAAAGRGRTD
jgi:hypothetical protein